jgi:molybdopterin-guanine dinucleotide biosynthesis protein A
MRMPLVGSEVDGTWRCDTVSAIVLAGGRNSRMGGADKAFLRVDDTTVFARTLELLHRCFGQVVVVTNRPERYADFDVEITCDEFRGRGPLAGLHAGLGRVVNPYAFVVACDMPFLRIGPIAFLVQRLTDQEAIIPWWEGDIEPLHAIYAAALRPRMARALASGVGAIRGFLPEVRAEYIPEAVMRQIEGADESFRNVNTPEEAARFAVRL